MNGEHRIHGTVPQVRALLTRAHPVIIGHRGCCALAPENTLPSFALALAAGADLVELDYRQSKDHVPVVIHDATLDRTTNARRQWHARRIRVADRTAVEIQSLDAGNWFDVKFAGTKVPLLSEALGFISDHGGVALIERKSGDAQTCAHLLRERHWINQVVVISFDWGFLRALHELVPNLVLGALGPPTRLADGRRSSRVSKRFSVRWLDKVAETGADLVIWNRRLSREAVSRAHARGVNVWVYTVNQVKLARRLVSLGVTGIITNNPREVRAADLGWRAPVVPSDNSQ